MLRSGSVKTMRKRILLRPLIARVFATIATIQVFVRSIRENDRKRIKDAHGDGVFWVTERPFKNSDAIAGYNIKVQVPGRNVLEVLHDILMEKRGFNNDTRGSITRLDPCYYLLPLAGWYVREIENWILDHILMPYRRRGPVFQHKSSTYMNKDAHLRQNSRDIVIYSDRPPVLTWLGEKSLRKIEPRLRGASTLKRLGIVRVRDILVIEPYELLDDLCYFTDEDIRPYAEAEARVWVGDAPSSEYVRRRFIRYKQLHFAQRVQEHPHVKLPKDPSPPLIYTPGWQWNDTPWRGRRRW